MNLILVCTSRQLMRSRRFCWLFSGFTCGAVPRRVGRWCLSGCLWKRREETAGNAMMRHCRRSMDLSTVHGPRRVCRGGCNSSCLSLCAIAKPHPGMARATLFAARRRQPIRFLCCRCCWCCCLLSRFLLSLRHRRHHRREGEDRWNDLLSPSWSIDWSPTISDVNGCGRRRSDFGDDDIRFFPFLRSLLPDEVIEVGWIDGDNDENDRHLLAQRGYAVVLYAHATAAAATDLRAEQQSATAAAVSLAHLLNVFS